MKSPERPDDERHRAEPQEQLLVRAAGERREDADAEDFERRAGDARPDRDATGKDDTIDPQDERAGHCAESERLRDDRARIRHRMRANQGVEKRRPEADGRAERQADPGRRGEQDGGLADRGADGQRRRDGERGRIEDAGAKQVRYRRRDAGDAEQPQGEKRSAVDRATGHLCEVSDRSTNPWRSANGVGRRRRRVDAEDESRETGTRRVDPDDFMLSGP